MKSPLILIGGGGHCKSCIDVIEREGTYQIAGIIDLVDNVDAEVLGYKVIGTDDDLPEFAKNYAMLVTIGQIKSPDKRVRIFRKLKELDAFLPIIISPLAYVSKHAKIGEGSIIMHHAVVNASASIGINCIVNTKALVEHDAQVEDHCHISTSAVVNGGVRVCVGSFLGSGVVTREYVEIGRNTVIGCHASVKKNVTADSVLK